MEEGDKKKKTNKLITNDFDLAAKARNRSVQRLNCSIRKHTLMLWNTCK